MFHQTHADEGARPRSIGFKVVLVSAVLVLSQVVTAGAALASGCLNG